MGRADIEIMRLVEVLHREKDIDRELVFRGIEAALVSAAHKHFGGEREITVQIDRDTGAITARDEHGEINPEELGRIAAQTAKQVIIQKFREAERDAVTQEFSGRLMSLVTGSVSRFEGPNIVVNLGRTEGFLPKSEHIPGETYHIGERIRALVIEARPLGLRVRVVLSRSRPELVMRLFELEVPEVADKVVEIKAIAREAGYRTKVAVMSLDPRVDCVGACVGVQGSRIRSIVDELGGEKVDIVRWSDAPDVMLVQGLKPAEVIGVKLDQERKRAEVTVPADQLSLAIGKRGQNVRLVCKLTGWDVDIRPPEEVAVDAATATAVQGDVVQVAPCATAGVVQASGTVEGESKPAAAGGQAGDEQAKQESSGGEAVA